MSNNNTLPEELKEQIRKEALENYKNQGLIRMTSRREGYIAGATEYAPYKSKYERLLTLYEEDTKLNMRLNVPGISEVEQEKSWQNFKQTHNI